MRKNIRLPLSQNDASTLRVGDRAFLTGKIYTARDAAHKKMAQDPDKIPVDLKGQILYYCGPTPARPGRAIGSAGPTTSSRMDPFTPLTLKLGIAGMIGKGKRSKEVRDMIKKYNAVYFVATGGAGALLAKHIIGAKVVGYRELGPEAIFELNVQDLPVIVANDAYGNDIFEHAVRKYGRK